MEPLPVGKNGKNAPLKTEEIDPSDCVLKIVLKFLLLMGFDLVSLMFRLTKSDLILCPTNL